MPCCGRAAECATFGRRIRSECGPISGQFGRSRASFGQDRSKFGRRSAIPSPRALSCSHSDEVVGLLRRHRLRCRPPRRLRPLRRLIRELLLCARPHAHGQKAVSTRLLPLRPWTFVSEGDSRRLAPALRILHVLQEMRRLVGAVPQLSAFRKVGVRDRGARSHAPRSPPTSLWSNLGQL